MTGRHGHGGPPSETKEEPGVVPLALVNTAQEVKLVRVDGGRRLCYRLAEMGLIPGTSFTVLRSGWHGPFIVAVKGSRLVLGRGMVHRIHVRPQ